MTETSLKRGSSTGIFLRILLNFLKKFIYRTPADCLVSTKVLFSDRTFLSPSFYLFITNNCSYGSLLRDAIKMKIFFFSLLTMIYSKTNMNVVKTISPRQ